MRTKMVALITGMLLSLPAVAAINTQPDPSHNMDDVMSTGVIYINHHGETMPQFAPGQQTTASPAEPGVTHPRR
ncbi:MULTISPECIES: hypothetical protein [Mangrovibacter]|uniref:Multiple antibiotic resistance protein MarB n=1 Tax=Mangrovibacter plantisponsor TaxID=451513 RepID=A0A317PJM7_9ENTR|nr:MULTISPECIES: hypothetical protein [Mangrovibacter]KEA54180.1 hypothetical protein DT73_02035 [Mangrovibacter sp. MFB070]PWW01088.1 hypothetical protein DES37_12256 [Mangrovibacter plantisponsor]